ncbi:MAG: hypothetical protein HFE82_07555 [Erysipelotrichaceae bacterium]|nr:hypothetical protein [Erysipelotrichaceae bacterium]
MHFLDTVTIFHAENDAYTRKVINGCYWYGSTGIALKDNGIIRDDSINIFFPCDVVDSNELVISKGDRIVKGDVPMIKSVNELSKYEQKITVLSVNENCVGSPLDNLLVSGK